MPGASDGSETASPSPTLGAFWGKAGSGQPHPAICHMIDVGCVVHAFLERPAAAGLLALLSEPFGGDARAALRTASFLGAAHDLGKISPGFQNKRPDLAPKLGGSPLLDETDHAKVTLYALKDHLAREMGLAPEVALPIAGAVAAHHGVLHTVSALHAAGNAAWKRARASHLEVLEATFAPDLRLLAERQDPPAPAWLMLLAGIVSVCDWIGSAEAYFPYEPEGARDLERYCARSTDRARRALRDTGFDGWAPDARAPSFGSLFSFEPNALQQVAIALGDRVEAPALFVIEAPMGVGKTEAALALAEALVRRHSLGGIYYALPTQATSNQMFGRLREFVERRYPGTKADLHLLHALSDLNPEYQELRLAAVSQDEGATVRASSWFVAAKRGLLAPFAVGTVDQALLAVMQVRHFFVRLLGLARKAVVLDEVHAYDTYVSELLDHLLAWLAALGSPVVILSATLPASRRAALVRAYAGQEPPPSSAYPLLTEASRNAAPAAIEIPGQAPRTIRLGPVDPSEGNFDRVAALVASLVRGGGCAAWICNTVDRAQRAYSEMVRAVGEGTEVLLLHARFPAGWRREREAAALARFGKGGERPRAAVLVATQVVEQSLDLDFDVLVSDFAPVDLLLQRAGRLHRHAGRTRPSGLAEPWLRWLEPPVEDGVPRFGVHERVYDPYVLLRSWLALRGRSEIVLPDGISALVEAGYGPEPSLEDPALVTALAEAKGRFQDRTEDARRKAEGNEIRPPDFAGGVLGMQEQVLSEEEDPRLHETLRALTRLTRPSVTLVCAERGPGGLVLLDGTALLPEREPERKLVRSARLSSVVVQRWEWVRHFVDEPPPRGWRRSAPLRDCRLAVFDGGHLDVGLGTRLELSPELGVVIRDRNAGGGG